MSVYTREQWIVEVRQMLEFLELNPQVPAPKYSERFYTSMPDNDQECRDILKMLGNFTKEFVDTDFYAVKHFGDVQLVLYTKREKVCKRIVVGKKVIPEEYVPGTEGRIVPEHEEEIVEWDCGEPVLVTAGADTFSDGSPVTEPPPYAEARHGESREGG